MDSVFFSVPLLPLQGSHRGCPPPLQMDQGKDKQRSACKQASSTPQPLPHIALSAQCSSRRVQQEMPWPLLSRSLKVWETVFAEKRSQRREHGEAPIAAWRKAGVGLSLSPDLDIWDSRRETSSHPPISGKETYECTIDIHSCNYYFIGHLVCAKHHVLYNHLS